jgi:hypothetical protein
MKRRKFLKKSAVAASLISIPGTLLPFTACKESPQKSSRISGSSGTGQDEISSTDYLQMVKLEKNLPKPIVSLKSYLPDAAG